MTYIPPSVAEARKTGNYIRLSELAKKGAETKKIKIKFRLNERLEGAKENFYQANEHICPLDD